MIEEVNIYNYRKSRKSAGVSRGNEKVEFLPRGHRLRITYTE